ncbi:MAG: 4'-phosphopantetheinyl transferase superfamily protein [Bacteroidales bacterium]|jgi:phosphopantetheinyl transferase|nr:4'-phosphopantetheinyl transferase superfamily protein [Bacteroidales bacterium]
MPVYLTEEINHAVRIAIWQLTEPEDELLRLRRLSERENLCFDVLKNANRRREWLAIRLLLHHLFQGSFDLCYLLSGRPILLEPNAYISISHSKDFVAVAVSETRTVGVDIERIRKNIARLQSRFLLSEEAAIIDSSDLLALHLYWGAKEAMYKMYSEYRPLFTQHLSLSEVNYMEQTAVGIFSKDNLYKTIAVSFRQIEDNLLVYCIE